jgi:hypothetical protein
MDEQIVANANDQALEGETEDTDLGDAAEKKGNNLMDWYGQD